MESELELIKQIIEGDRKAYRSIIERYQNMVYNLAYRMTGNKSDAEDITQDTFIKAYEHISEFKIGYKFSTWLYTLALNITRNKLKRRKFSFLSLDKLLSTDDEKSEELPVQVASKDNTEKEVMENEQKQFMNKMLDTLPYKYRSIFYLRFLEDYPYEEIAQISNLSVGTVKTYLFRARQILYKKFSKPLKQIP